MRSSYPAPPPNLRSLRDRLTQAARREGVLFGRLQQHVAVLVVTQFASSLTDESGLPLLLVKGGSALELRRGIPVKPRRFVVKLKYQGQPFASIPVEVSTVEADNATVFDEVNSEALQLVGLPIPRPVPCMTLPWQIAQKLRRF